MDEAAGPTIGQRNAQLRGTRMTQTSPASAAGVSVDLIRKLEQGRTGPADGLDGRPGQRPRWDL